VILLTILSVYSGIGLIKSCNKLVYHQIIRPKLLNILWFYAVKTFTSVIFGIMKKLILYIFCLLISINAYGQLHEHFEDGELFSDPTWSGDVSDFEVLDNELHLNAEDEGTSSLFVPVTFPDSVIWNLNFKMQFAPSNSNKLTLFLASANTDLENLKAYYLEVGETGSNDALHFYSIENNVIHELQQATDGTLGGDPAEADLLIRFDREKIWTISADYNGDGLYEDEIEYYDNEFSPADYAYFGLKCTYTSTRKDKFYFKYFDIQAITPDISPPLFSRYEVQDNKHISIEFNEALSPDNINDLNNYTLFPDLAINQVNWDMNFPKRLAFEFVDPMTSGVNYEMTIENITDEKSNVIIPFSFNFSLIEKPDINDLVINEVLFNPYTGGNDFVEIYNRSAKTIQLDSLILINQSSNRLYN